MSDYITDLRADLVEAAARHQSRGALARTTTVVRPRAWSRPALAAAVVTAACLAAVLVGVRAIGPPAPKPAQPRIVLTTKVAAVATDAVARGGDLWVTDFNEGLVRVDAASGRVAARVPLGGTTQTIAVGPDRLWAMTSKRVGDGAVLVQVEPRSGRVLTRDPVEPSAVSAFAVDAGGLWLPSLDAALVMVKVPAPGRAPTAFLRLHEAYAVGVLATPPTLWVVTNDGTLLEVDSASGQIVHSLPRAVSGAHGNGGNEFPENGLAGDANGVWAVDQDRGIVVRFAGGHIVRRIRTGGYPGPIAYTAGALWVSVADPLKRRFKIVRFDRASGRPTASVDVSFHVPKALVPTSHGLWVVASDGTATLIR
jgi:hypothetical protein